MTAALLLSSDGIAASTSRTVPIRSTSNSFCHEASSLPIASALTLATTMSTPPKSAATSATQAFNAGPSPTSTARPDSLTP